MLRYGTTGHSMVPNGVIGDLYVQFPFQQKKNLLNSYTGSASTTTFGQGGSRGGALSCLDERECDGRERERVTRACFASEKAINSLIRLHECDED